MITKPIIISELKLSLITNIQEQNSNNKYQGDILFIHGLGCSKESFNEAFSDDRFSEYRLIAPDLPGFGASSKDDNLSYNMQEQAKYLKELIKILDIQKPIILGHSMGGAIALLLIKQLKLVKYFFSLEGNLVDDDCGISRETAILSEKEFLTEEYRKNPMKYRCRRRGIDPAPDPLAFYKSSVSLVSLSDSGELFEQYQNLPFPKTYIYGEENRNTKIVSLLKGEDIVEISGCGHFMMNDNPKQCYTEIANRIEALN